MDFFYENIRVIVWSLSGIAWLLIGIIIVYKIYQGYFKETVNEDKLRKQYLKNLLESQSQREHLDKYNEDEFWKMVEDFTNRNKGSYKNFLGLFKDKLMKFTDKELIEMDNLLMSLHLNAFTWDMAGASFIIFKDGRYESLQLLISILISKGEIIYNNVVNNVDLLVNQEFIDFDDRTLFDVVAEVYLMKTGKLMPYYPLENIELQGEKWEEKDIPSRFSTIWDKYA